MTRGIRPLVVGNWKMNGLKSSLNELRALQLAEESDNRDKYDALICVPFTILAQAAELVSDSFLAIGAQDCHENSSGPHTGDVSAEMIVDCSAQAVIVGHSERRVEHGEADRKICKKAGTALQWGLMTIICIGESGQERKNGETLDVLKRQMDGSIPNNVNKGEIVIAYEPVWSIGSGLTPTQGDVEHIHKFMREELIRRFGETAETIRLLYGGSVTSANAPVLTGINNVDGVLAGGASLKAGDFSGICAAYE